MIKMMLAYIKKPVFNLIFINKIFYYWMFFTFFITMKYLMIQIFIKKIKTTKYKIRINSYTPNGNMVNADYYLSMPTIMKKKWHKVFNLDMRKTLARKYPKKRK